ncbi:MAG: hypothetical protein ABMB14_00495 [Myxococcota bacterium]
MSRRLFVVVFAAGFVGCTGETPAVEYTEDIRIDAAADGNDPDSFGTRMCMTGDGTVYVLWMDNRENPDEDVYDIWMNRSVNLGAKDSWLPAAVKVNQGDGNVWKPDLYCNELGVFVVWEDDRDGELDNHQVYFNRSTDKGESFLPEDKLLEEDPDGNSMSLEPKITGFGQDLFVVWYDSLNGAYDVLVSSSSDAGESWHPPTRVDSDDPAGSAYSARPKIAVGENGLDVWVVWEDSRDGKADIYFARSETGGNQFDEDQRLDEGDDDGANDSFEPQLCSDGGDNVYAVWHDARNGDGRDIYMNYSGDKGIDWGGAATRLEVDSPGFGNSLFPVCAAEGSTLHVAWHDKLNEGEGYDIYYRTVEAGIPGNDPVRLDVGTPAGYANSLDPRIALNDGTVLVAWQDGRGEVEAGSDNGYDDLYYNYSEGGAPFSASEDFRIDSMYDGKSFKVDTNVTLLGGSWYAAWTDGRGGTSDIYFQTFAIGDQAKPPPLEALEQAQGQ